MFKDLGEAEGGPFDAAALLATGLASTGLASTAITAACASPAAGCHPLDFWRMSARLSCFERRGHARSPPVVYCLCSIESTNSSRVI